MIEGREASRPVSRVRSVALASVSPRRRQLLESLGLEVVLVRSSYEESEHVQRHADPRDLVIAHAQGKAAGAEAAGPPLLVAADTTVVIDGDVLGKPADAHEAQAMLSRLAGRQHTV